MNILFSAFSDELLKIAAPRYEREISAGNITRSQVAPSVIDGLGPISRKMTRDQLYAPAPRTEASVEKSRNLRDRLYGSEIKQHGPAALKMPPQGPGITTDLFGNAQVGVPPDSGQYARTMASGPLRSNALAFLHKSAPHTGAYQKALLPREGVDRALNHAILGHEVAERDLHNQPAGTAIRPVASHLGVRPLLAEKMRLVGDSEAMKHMSAIRQDRDNALLERLIRRAGGRPDAPLPMEGRHERALNRMLDQSAGELHPFTRFMNMKQSGKGANIPYVPPDAAGMPRAGTGSLGQRARSLWSGAARRLRFLASGR